MVPGGGSTARHGTAHHTTPRGVGNRKGGSDASRMFPCLSLRCARHARGADRTTAIRSERDSVCVFFFFPQQVRQCKPIHRRGGRWWQRAAVEVDGCRAKRRHRTAAGVDDTPAAASSVANLPGWDPASHWFRVVLRGCMETDTIIVGVECRVRYGTVGLN
uniref:Uncharacterized protein n=1 Tax=Pseudo-nitzschia australis TaxID=44445 RepID=A0A7S4AQ47_9STRA